MRKGIPNLIALQIFEAAARHESFTRTAEELSLTQSAVCRQIAALEQRLGVALFIRVKKRVRVTDHGRDYAQRIRVSLERIERDTLELVAQRGIGSTLELAVVPTFASQWLIPRLPLFKAARPDITVNLSIRTEPFLLSESPFDGAVYFGNSVWAGTQGERLFEEGNMVPVCSASLLMGASTMALDSLMDMPLLHLSTRPNAWRDWFAHYGLPQDARAVRGPRYELFTMLSSAAQAGLGVALMPRVLLSALSAQAGTVAPNFPVASKSGYYLVSPALEDRSEPFAAFAEWLGEMVTAGVTF